MRRIFFLFLWIFAVGVLHAQVITGYEYWIDNNIAEKTFTPITPVHVLHLQTDIPMTNVSMGLHSLNLRFSDDSNTWSTVLQKFFTKVPYNSGTDNKIVSFEYWIDNDFGTRIFQDVSPSAVYHFMDSLNLSQVSPGFHIINMRFKDSNHNWSTSVQKFFIKTNSPVSGERKIVCFEYWIDENVASKTTQYVSPSSVLHMMDSLNLASVSAGLHALNIRFKDNAGFWSSLTTRFFTKSQGGNVIPNKIVSFRLWYDDNPLTMETYFLAPPVNIYQVLDSLETPFLTVGNHLINYQFYDLNNAYSSVRSDTFYVASCLPHGGRSISGPDSLCLGETNIVYEIASIKNAASYHWTVPIGAQIISGQNSPSITVDYPVPVSGNITVYASNSCGNGVSIVLPVNVFAPAIAGQVTGSGSYFFGEEFYPTLEGNVGSVIKWQQRWNGGDWQDVAETGPTYAVIPDTTGIWDFRAVVQSGLCGTVISDFATANVLPVTRTVSINLFLEGLFDPSASQMNKAQGEFGDMYPDTVADQIQVKLSRPTYPYATYRIVNNVDLNQDGSCTFTIPRAGSYYLVIKHRNSIETWSSAPVSLLSEPVFYDFTTASSQAYGDNQRDMGGIFTFWGGDVNQDGIVDGGDMNPVDNAVTAITFGYVAEDVNGDGIVDGGDMNIVDNNTTAIIMVLTP